MKLHLPKRLFTALLTAITLAAAPAALTLGSAAWGAVTKGSVILYVNESTGEISTTAKDGFTEKAVTKISNVSQGMASGDLNSGDDILAFALKSGDNWFGSKQNQTLTYDSDILIYDENAEDNTSQGLIIGNGYSGSTVVFNGRVLGNGDFFKTHTSTVSFTFTGDMSKYTGNMTFSVANATLKFANQTGTGVINSTAGTVELAGATVNNESIVAANLKISSADTTTVGRVSAAGVGAIAPSITTTTTLTVVSGATLNLANGSLTSSGTFTNSGSVIVGSAASMVLNGSYTDTADSSLTVNGSLTVGASGSLTVNGSLTSTGSFINNGAVTVGAGGLFVLGNVIQNAGTITTADGGAFSVDVESFIANGADVAVSYVGGSTTGNGFKQYAVDILAGEDLSDAISVQTVTLNGIETVQTTTGSITTLGSTYYINSGTETYKGADNAESGAIAGATDFVVQNGTLSISRDGNISTIKSLDIREGGEVVLSNWNTSLGSANSLVDVTLSDGGIFSFGNGNAADGGGKMYLNLTVDGSGTLAGSNYGDNSVVYGTVQGNGTLTLGQKHGKNRWTVAAAISDDAEGALELNVTRGVDNHGGVVLSGANTYSGGTTIGEGALLKANHATALGSGTVTLNGGTLVLLQGLTISELSSTVAASIVKSEANATLTVSSGSYAGALQNGSDSQVLSLIKTGAGTLTLSGANTYTGTTSVQGGELILTSALGSGNISVSEGAALTLNTNSTIQLSSAGRISGAGTVHIMDGTTLLMSSTGGTASVKGSTIHVHGGGILNLDSNDCLGWGGNATGAILLKGESGTKVATLQLGGRQTMTTSLLMQGNALVESTGGTEGDAGGLNPLKAGGAQITATGKNNIINATLHRRDAFLIEVTYADDELEVQGNVVTQGGGISGGYDGSYEAGSIVKDGAGKLTFSGSGNTFDRKYLHKAGTSVMSGTANFTSTVEIQSGKFETSGTTTMSGAITNSGTFEVSGGTATISGSVTNTGAITVSGGTATLSGAVTNSGAITVSGGEADFTGTLTMGAGSSLTVSNGSLSINSLLVSSTISVNKAAGASLSFTTVTVDELNNHLTLLPDTEVSYKYSEDGVNETTNGNGFRSASATYILFDGYQWEGTVAGYEVEVSEEENQTLITSQGEYGTVFYVNKGTYTDSNSSNGATAYYIASGANLVLNSKPESISARDILAGFVVAEEGSDTAKLTIGINNLVTGEANYTTTYSGVLELARGITFTFGSTANGQEGTDVNTRSLAGVELNNGSVLQYQGNATNAVFKNLTVIGAKEAGDPGATFKIIDMPASPAIEFTGVTTLNHDLTILSNYGGKVNIEHLSGSGTLSSTGSDNDEAFTTTIESLAGFTGCLSFTDAEHTVVVSTGNEDVSFMGLSAEGVRSFTFNVNANTTITRTPPGDIWLPADPPAFAGTLSASTGTVNIAAGKTLTLGDGSTTTTHTIGTLTSTSTSKVIISRGSNLILTSLTNNAQGDITGDGALTLQTGSTVGLGHDIFGSAINTINLTGAGSGLEITSSTTQPTNFGKIQNINVEDGATFYNRVTSYGDWVLNPENNINISLAGAGNGSATGAALSLGYDCGNGGTVAFGDKVNFSLSDDATVIVHGRNRGNNADIAGVINTTIQGNGHTLTKIGTGKLTLENGASNTSLNVNEGELVLKGAATTSERVELNGGTLKLADKATITTKQGSADAATMSKVQMNSTGITGTAQDGSSSIANADIEIAQLAQDASFTIQDMTLTNTSINAASVNTQVNLTNVSASATQLSGGKFVVTNQATMNTAQVAAGGSEGRITFSASTTLLSGITLNSGSITVDLGDLSSYAAMGPGKYDLSITLSGFNMSEYSGGDYAGSPLQFAAGSWLSELLAQDNNANVQISITQAEEGAAAAAGAGSGSTGVSYSTGNVGMVITITGLNVPEPTTATLSLLALAALAGRRRRK